MIENQEQENYKLEVRFVYEGNYQIINGEALLKKAEGQNVKDYFNHKVKGSYLKNIMNKYVLKKYGINPKYEGNLCSTCAHMLDCDKIKDPKKRPLQYYSFIKSGLQLVLIEQEKLNKYKIASKKYKDLEKEEDFAIDDYPELKHDLEESGIYVPIISVFSCENYMDDETYIKRNKTEMAIKKSKASHKF